jgi:hypothetical protein
MKRIFLVFALVILMAGNAFAAASSVTLVPPVYESASKNQLIIPLLCVADSSDGTFVAKTLTAAIVGFNYFTQGYYLGHAWTVNDATTYPSTAATITITDANGQQLTGTTAGDTLTVATTASGIGMLSAARGAAQRPVTSNLIITISDTGDHAETFMLYLVLIK